MAAHAALLEAKNLKRSLPESELATNLWGGILAIEHNVNVPRSP